VEPAEQREVTERFIAAAASGDIDALLEVLDPDVSGGADVGDTRYGRDDVARGVLQYLGPGSGTTVLSLPARDHAVLVALRGERVGALLTLTIEGDRIVHFEVIAHPARLAPISAALGA
jgi:RNA polymerase sigma-70 factor (ECF subfamily)